MHNPFARPKPNPKRERPRRTGDRVRLKGAAMTILRRNKATEAMEHCQTCGDYAPLFTEPFADPNGKMVYHGELSHKRHAANKSDTMEDTLWECRTCHQVERHNPKSVPRKPGRTMNQKEALAYWKGIVCFCSREKPAQTSFCLKCMSNLSPQLQYDVMNATGKEWLEAVALAEQALLAGGQK